MHVRIILQVHKGTMCVLTSRWPLTMLIMKFTSVYHHYFANHYVKLHYATSINYSTYEYQHTMQHQQAHTIQQMNISKHDVTIIGSLMTSQGPGTSNTMKVHASLRFSVTRTSSSLISIVLHRCWCSLHSCTVALTSRAAVRRWRERARCDASSVAKAARRRWCATVLRDDGLDSVLTSTEWRLTRGDWLCDDMTRSCRMSSAVSSSAALSTTSCMSLL